MTRRAAALLASIVVLALGVRLAYIFEIRGTPVTDILLIDSDTYDRFARLILGGTFHGENVYAMNVLYPYFLAAVYRVFADSTLAVQIVQAALDGANVLLIGAIGAALFDRRVALLSAAIAAVYGPFVFYSGALLTPTLINTLCLVTLWLMLRHRDRGHRRWLLGAGATLGLATLGRGNAVLFLPLALIVLRLWSGRWATAARRWLPMAVGTIVILGAVTLRNYAVERQIVPVSANYAAFYIGHNPGARGLFMLPEFTEGASFEDEVEGTRMALSERAGRELTLAESSRMLFRDGLSFLAHNPAAELRLAARKLYYFWNRTESPTNLNYYFARDFSRLLRWLPLHLGILGPIGLLGVWMTRRRWRDLSILYLFGAVPVVTCVLFFTAAEYRLPVVPVVILFTAAAVVSIAERGRSRSPRRSPARRFSPVAALALATLVGCGMMGNTRDALLRAQSLKRVDYLNFGTLYRNRGDLVTARTMLERSLEIDPAFGPAHAALAEVAHREGRETEAMRHLEAARRFRVGGQYRDAVPPDATEALLFATTEQYRRGEHELAMAGFTRLAESFERGGRAAEALRMRNNVGLCQYKLGELDAAERTFRAVLATDSTYVYAFTNLARVLAADGRRSEAEVLYRRALDLAPDNPRVRNGYQAFLEGRAP